jgi:regulator of sirC expression with transglutaminase-like and TPR domain
MPVGDFETLALQHAPPLDELAIALAAEFGDVASDRAVEQLDELGREVADCRIDGLGVPHGEAAVCRVVLAERHGFGGSSSDYGDPRNSMLDQVLDRRVGLPITLSVVYVEVARRAGIELAGVGLPGHFVVGHFGAGQPLLIDPFERGAVVPLRRANAAHVRPWGAHEVALRMLNNLVRSYGDRGDLSRALHAADLRQLLPVHDALRDQQEIEHASLLARLN